MNMQLSEKAQKAGITQEEGQFLQDLLPVMAIGAIFNVPLIDKAEVERMLVIFDKLYAVDQNMPPAVLEMVNRMRERISTPTQNAPTTDTVQ